jgi:hypothetical protein
MEVTLFSWETDIILTGVLVADSINDFDVYTINHSFNQEINYISASPIKVESSLSLIALSSLLQTYCRCCSER